MLNEYNIETEKILCNKNKPENQEMHTLFHTDNSLYYLSVAFMIVVHVYVFGFTTKHNNLMLGFF